MDSRKIHTQNLIEKGNLITKTINNSGLLSVRVMFEVEIEESGEKLIAKFYLNEKTYSRGLYYIESEGLYKGSLVAQGAGVNSDIGNRTGMLMFHLQLLLVMTSGVRIFNLLNFTDEPARAARGIYALLDVDTTLGTHGTPRKEFAHKSLHDKLLLSDGEMRLVVDGSSILRWKKQMMELAETLEETLEGTGYPWNPDVKINMERFIRQLGERDLAGGRRKRRKSKTLKKKHRKFSKKNTKKSRKKRQKSRK